MIRRTLRILGCWIILGVLSPANGTSQAVSESALSPSTSISGLPASSGGLDDHSPMEIAIQAFDRGTSDLHAGRFTDALEQFHRAEETGLASGALYYNVGYAYYRLNQTGESVRYFSRAARLLPDDPRIKHSLGIISSRLPDSFSNLPAPIWKTGQRLLFQSVSTSTYFIIGLILYLITVVIIGLSIVDLGPVSWYARLRGVLGSMALILILIAVTATIWPPWPNEAVILAEEVAIHDQPDSESPSPIRVHEGLVVATLSSADGWTLVQLPNGTRGWLEAHDLGAI